MKTNQNDDDRRSTGQHRTKRQEESENESRLTGGKVQVVRSAILVKITIVTQTRVHEREREREPCVACGGHGEESCRREGGGGAKCHKHINKAEKRVPKLRKTPNTSSRGFSNVNLKRKKG